MKARTRLITVGPQTCCPSKEFFGEIREYGFEAHLHSEANREPLKRILMLAEAHHDIQFPHAEEVLREDPTRTDKS